MKISPNLSKNRFAIGISTVATVDEGLSPSTLQALFKGCFCSKNKADLNLKNRFINKLCIYILTTRLKETKGEL